ncbi:hypothetical protein I4F81_008388 [Pyropia yezoensis]|uniref:Uncharacterized protein n=1 Tax=Pyropia yezoensis TaxID=2788 RepID=A0ACC3C7A4_PYRYE|nr:hypothetical protein I4F81_008388 [Neopyropia yezoensis]
MGTRRCRLATTAAAVVAAVATLVAVRPGAAAPPGARATPIGTTGGGGAAPATALDSASVRVGGGDNAPRPPAAPAPGLHFLIDGALSPSVAPRPVLHSYGSASDALTVLFMPAVAGEAVTATRFEGLDAAVCTAAGVEVKPAAPGAVAAGGGGDGGGAPSTVIPAGASNMTLTMDFDGHVGVTDWTFVVDTVDKAGVARSYTCGGTYRVCGLSLTDPASGAVLSGDGGAGLSLGTYADVLAAGMVRLGVRAVACAAGTAPALEEVALTTRDVDCEEDLRVFPQPDSCPTMADDLRPGCSFAFSMAGDELLVRPAAYRTGAGKVDASLVWPAAAIDGEAFETGLSISVASLPVPPPVLLPASLDAMDVYGGELLAVPAFNAPSYGDDLDTCTLSVADRTAPLLRDECTIGAAEQSLVFLSAGGPAFSTHNRTDVTCTTAAGPDGGAVAKRPAAVSVSFGNGTLAVKSLANGTAFLASAAAAGDAALSLTLRYGAYAPDRFSAAKSGAVAAAVAAAAGVPADAVAVVDVAPGPGGDGCDQTLLLRSAAGADVAATQRVVGAVVKSGELAAAVRLPSSGVALVALGVARGVGPLGADGAGDTVSGPSGLAIGLIVGGVAAAAAVLALVGAAVKASHASAAAESDLSSSSGPLGVPAASAGAGGGGDILRDVYGRSGEPHGLAGGDAGMAAAIVPSGRSDVASSTYSV